MNKLLLLFAFFCVHYCCFPQSNGLTISSTGSLYAEHLNFKWWERERNSFALSYGVGAELHKKYSNNWGFDIGIRYLNRRYVINIEYDQFYFEEYSQDSIFYGQLREFGYQIIELPFGITRYFATGEKWITYVNLETKLAIDFQSYYTERLRPISYEDHKFHLFSGSISGSFGLGRRLTRKLVFIFEPALRIINIQRNDPIIWATWNKWTFLNDFGLHIGFEYEL